ncbi:hypothetical protein [Bythopirellula polymerisocia]|uniref:Uncharacterized protein n=1 Tax=Bythopirellula polymerisocia TaxID=2528003 RepID=A0A5C6CZS3_9BACT|nr:hypothetical protein [Bythopirellula polymerisocia]TWU30090.1 hypothetical protein Pla144_08760 [Bythopirellula polymerisocia]
MDKYLPGWKEEFVSFVQDLLQESIAKIKLLADGSQLNRRTKAAWRKGRRAQACYLAMGHHRRRLARRAEIRRLVEGPVRYQ